MDTWTALILSRKATRELQPDGVWTHQAAGTEKEWTS